MKSISGTKPPAAARAKPLQAMNHFGRPAIRGLESHRRSELIGAVKTFESDAKASTERLQNLLRFWLEPAPPLLKRRVPAPPVSLCKSIGEDLRELAAARSAGELSEFQFVAAMLSMERGVCAENGFTLTASNTIDDWTVVKLRARGTKEACSSFEFQPETGAFRSVGQTPAAAAA